MKIRVSLANFTEHPKIFSQVYWGASDVTDDSVEIEIIINRNEFIKKFNIKDLYQGLWPFSLSRGNAGIDHPEFYKSYDGSIIFINSPYKGSEQPIDALGMKKYKPLYNSGANTYIRVFSDSRHLRNVFKKAGFQDWDRSLF